MGGSRIVNPRQASAALTTGSKDRSSLVTVIGPFGSVTGGTYNRKTWSGGDLPDRVRSNYEKQFYKVSVLRWRKVYDPVRRRWTWERYEKQLTRYKRVLKPKPRRIVLPPNSYTMDLRKDVDPVVTSYTAPDNGSSPFPNSLAWWIGGVRRTAEFTANEEYRLYEKLRERLVGSDFNVGVFLAEASESLGMIFNAATRIDRAYRHATRFNFVAAARALIDGPIPRGVRFSSKRSLSSNWLELQYGWLPLLKDVEAGAQYLAHMSSVPMQARYAVRTRINGDGNLSPSPAYVYQTSSEVLSVQLVAYVKEVDLVKLSGLTDPASVLWERLPYSFVADWFLPVGNYLSARALAQAVQGTFVRTLTWRAKASGFTYKVPPPANQRTDISALGSGVIERLEMNRVVLGGLPVRLPTASGIGESLTWKRTANAVALLVQRFGSR